MPRKFGQEQALTVLFIGVIAFLFVFQARVALLPGHQLSFSIDRMNLAYGAVSSSSVSTSSSSSSVGVESGHCSDGLDNDTDGLVDCSDSADCGSDPACISSSSSTSSITSETGLCSNSFDDDGDGFVDCADSDCSADVACVVSSSSSSSSVGNESLNCSNSFDDDGDGLIDCNDPDCSANIACSSSSSSSSSLACGADSGANQALLYNGHCYLLFTGTAKTWSNAKTACAAYHTSYLASITVSAENTAVTNAFNFLSSTWIGLNDQSIEGTYAWDHGNPFSYANWASGQPDNSGNQDCGSLQTLSHQWDDLGCANTNDYLCEYAVTSTCGDGQQELSEGCDDGNTSNGDGCSASCAVESGWSCSGTLPTACAEVCGDGIKTSGEGCDDGNTSNGDGCTATCAVQSGWSCTGSPSSCSTTCGDGIVAGSEQCDDGNGVDTDGCRNSCVFATCGDGIVQPNGADGISGDSDDETCDTAGDSVSCDSDCTAVACGDQHVNVSAGETCDDGNSSNTDGCLNSCIVADCGDGYVRNGVEECEPPGTGTCGGTCQEERGVGNVSQDQSSSEALAGPPPHCGNAVVEPELGEKCDLGRTNGLSPLCDRSCNNTFCGDGKVQAAAEECEPVRQADGTFVAPTCGGRQCAIPVCTSAGDCFGGCSWQFLPACPQSSSEPNLFPLNQDFFTIPSRFSLVGVPTPNDATNQSRPLFTQEIQSSESGVPNPLIAPPTFHIGVSSSQGMQSSVVSARCGNGILEPNEQCDDGVRNSDTLPDSCRTDCTFPKCGDGVTDFGEECDDANTILGDGCTPQCTRSSCGNGILEVGEDCDDGIRNSDTAPDVCRTHCVEPTCGDGVLDAGFGEQCDEGLNNSNTAPGHCRINCVRPHCGDGVKDDNEQCDDGNSSNLDSCSNTCEVIGCGNGIKDWNEQCDDGNKTNGDGCSSICVTEKQSILQWINKAIRLPFGW